MTWTINTSIVECVVVGHPVAALDRRRSSTKRRNGERRDVLLPSAAAEGTRLGRAGSPLGGRSLVEIYVLPSWARYMLSVVKLCQRNLGWKLGLAYSPRPPKKGWHIQSLLTQRLLGIEDFLAHLQIGPVTTPAAQHLHPLFLLDGETAFGLSVPGTEVVAVP